MIQKTKEKRGVSSWLHRRIPFALLWALAMAIIAALSRTITDSAFFKSLSYQQMAIVLVLWTDIVGGMLQVQLIERFLKRSMRGWLVVTLVGNLITLFVANLITTNRAIPANVVSGLIPIVYLVPPLLLQTIWLARRVEKPWLWGASTFILSIGFNKLYERMPYLNYSPIAPVLGFLSAFIVGIIMHYLWSHPRDSEKAKHDLTADGQSDEFARLERLQELENSSPLWEAGDHPTLQRDTR